MTADTKFQHYLVTKRMGANVATYAWDFEPLSHGTVPTHLLPLDVYRVLLWRLWIGL